MTVIFDVQFNGGIGTAEVTIFQKGHSIDVLTFDTSDAQVRDLEDGFYILTITGNSSPGGTVFTISNPTNPLTPDDIKAGPMSKAYVLHI